MMSLGEYLWALDDSVYSALVGWYVLGQLSPVGLCVVQFFCISANFLSIGSVNC